MTGKKTDAELSDKEIADRERRVLEHFLSSKPEPHKAKLRIIAKAQPKPAGKNHPKGD